MQASVYLAVGSWWRFLLGIIGEFYTYAWLVGDDEEAIFCRDWLFDHDVLGELMLPYWVLLQCEVGYSCRNLEAGGGADWPQGVVRYDTDIVGLCQSCYLLRLGDSSA